MAFLLRYAELQAEQQTQSGKREQLQARLAVLRDSSQQGSSPGAVARKAAASAQAVLHKVGNICPVFAWSLAVPFTVGASCKLSYDASCCSGSFLSFSSCSAEYYMTSCTACAFASSLHVFLLSEIWLVGMTLRQQDFLLSATARCLALSG